MNNTWSDEFVARFKNLSDRDVEVWDEIIENEIRNLKPGEVLAAVRTLGEEKRQGKHKYAPTVEDLISAIIKNRWKSRISREGMAPAGTGCALCQGFGWMPFGGSLKNDVVEFGVKRHVEDNWGFYVFSVPCLCSRGNKELNAYRQDDREKIIDLAKRVLDWKKTITAESPLDDRLMAVDEG